MSSQSFGTRMTAAILAVAATSFATACTAGEVGEAGEEPKYAPASLAPADPSGVKQVTFTEDAARRIELQTGTAQTSGQGVVVDYAALIYDQNGGSWVYVMPEPLTYRRTKVDVLRIEGDRVTLVRGPVPGTRVVTRGAAEVYGAELEMAGSH
jgi:hypothetical protein